VQHYLWHNHRADSDDNFCWVEDWVMLDSEFLVYAIREKIAQGELCGFSQQLEMECAALVGKVNENEKVPRMSSLTITR
jgi:hypothetical protein